MHIIPHTATATHTQIPVTVTGSSRFPTRDNIVQPFASLVSRTPEPLGSGSTFIFSRPTSPDRHLQQGTSPLQWSCLGSSLFAKRKSPLTKAKYGTF